MGQQVDRALAMQTLQDIVLGVKQHEYITLHATYWLSEEQEDQVRAELNRVDTAMRHVEEDISNLCPCRERKPVLINSAAVIDLHLASPIRMQCFRPVGVSLFKNARNSGTFVVFCAGVVLKCSMSVKKAG